MPINNDITLDKGARKIVVKKTQDTTPVMEQNKIFRNHIPEAQKGDLQRIAQIPLIALQIQTKAKHGHSNWYKLNKEQQMEIIRAMISSNEFQNFKVGSKGL
ncbi:hypothetical protein [uncultured Mediterranean phage uvMED]|nr:hypothetical protein [uncultured Mediterranean phage uvMED]BAR17794.1 hypothetical protein [uncultured Mediterranean phage uvMED]|tara:strand:+ start:2589 stop:2894 length:306 start_codon:yes stop_codon:yes gene_type:complete